MKKLLAACVLLTSTFSSNAFAQRGKQYEAMDYGPFLAGTYIYPKYNKKEPAKDTAYRGIVVPFNVGGVKTGVLFDTELMRYMTVWSGGFINWDGITFNQVHGSNPSPAGKVHFQTKHGPGWANNGDLKDPRKKNVDPRTEKPGTAYGPMPRPWARYKGLYRHDDGVMFEYTVGECRVLDNPSFVAEGDELIFCRDLTLENTNQGQQVVIADLDGATTKVANKRMVQALKGGEEICIAVQGNGAELAVIDGTRVVLNIAAQNAPASVKICMWVGDAAKTPNIMNALDKIAKPADLRQLTKGGKARFPQTVSTKGKLGDATKSAYSIDSITVPFENPYKSWMRIAGVDFFSDGRAALTTWSGDVWVVSSIDDKLENVTWKRFAAGLFQPLGIKIVDNIVHVLCRDGVFKLQDLNGDGEADYYQCFNNDNLITANFHEFMYELHTDPQGNFYYITGGPVKPGGRGWDELTPSHGSLHKLSKDGSKLEVLARGFRAPNGMGLGPNGEITSGDNEGTWQPTTPLNWIKPGGFYGVRDFLPEPKPAIRDNPLCWLPKENPPYGQYDNSSGGQVWITGKEFGPLSGQLMHMSYGTCKLFNVLKEEVGGQMQGGVVEALKFDSGVCRARFVEKENALYLVGLRGWQTTATKDAGFYRVRYTGKPANLPIDMRVSPTSIQLTFSDPLDKKSAETNGNYNVQRWNYRWTQTYGSPHFKVSDPKKQGEDVMELTSAVLGADGRTLTLNVKDIQPVMQMRIVYRLKAADGTAINNQVMHTINAVGDMRGEVHIGEYKIVKN